MTEFELNGVRLQLPKGLGGPQLSQKLKSGGYEASEARAVLKRVKPGQRVLELGGGMGYIGSLCASLAGAGNVTVVEANPAMLPVIRANLERNGHGMVRLVHGAVSGDGFSGKTLLFECSPSFWGAHIADVDANPAHVIEVPLLRISDLFARYRPQVVIMDIEGAEAYLFERRWPRHVQAVLMELHPRCYSDSTIKRIFDCLSESGLIYDTASSSGGVVGFRRMRQKNG